MEEEKGAKEATREPKKDSREGGGVGEGGVGDGGVGEGEREDGEGGVGEGEGKDGEGGVGEGEPVNPTGTEGTLGRDADRE